MWQSNFSSWVVVDDWILLCMWIIHREKEDERKREDYQFTEQRADELAQPWDWAWPSLFPENLLKINKQIFKKISREEMRELIG